MTIDYLRDGNDGKGENTNIGICFVKYQDTQQTDSCVTNIINLPRTRKYTEITNLAGSEVECVWANIQCDKQHIALGVMYRPPSSNNAYLKYMLDQIDNVFSYTENMILMGDHSYDYTLDESLSSNPLHQIEILYCMRQLINSPTRVTLTTSTLIDVMFSTEHESHIVTGVYNISLSDHYMTYTIYSKIARKTCLHK